MKENREFDILENADDNEIELLAKVPVLSKNEKERMLKMSKKKLENMNTDNNGTVQVSGVEEYRRPKIYSFVSVAACAALLAGIVGTSALLHRNGRANETAYTETVVELFDKINELNLICAGGGVEGTEEGGSHVGVMYDESLNADYIRVTDSRFSTLDEVKAYFRQYAADPLMTAKYDTYFVKPDSVPVFRYDYDASNTATLKFNEREDAEAKAERIELVRESDGKVNVELRRTDGDDINMLYESCYDFSAPAQVNGSSCTVYGRIVLEDGQWKMSEYAFNANELTDTGSHIYAAYAAMEALEDYDMLVNTSDMGVDENDSKPLKMGDIGLTYYRVTNNAFKKATDVKKYLSASFTNSFINGNPNIFDSNTPVFKEFDGKLYHVGAVSGIRYTSFFGEPKITEIGSDSFRIEVKSENFYGYIEDTEIICVREKDGWKVDKFYSDTYGRPAEN